MEPISSIVTPISASQLNGLQDVHYAYSTNFAKLNSANKKISFASIFTTFTMLFNTLTSFFSGINFTPTTTTKTPDNIYRPNCSYFNCDECGVASYAPNIKIVGGVNAVPHSWPSQVYIEITYDRNVYIEATNSYVHVNQNFQCGGTLINRDTVLGAAHCIIKQIKFEANGDTYYVNVEIDPAMYKMYIGYQNIEINDGYGIQRDTRNVIPHPNYDDDSMLNDLALFRLTKMVTLNEGIQVACLPNRTNPNYPNNWGETVFAIGWGRTKENGQTSSVLNNVALTLYEPTQCANVLTNQAKNWNSQLCAGYNPGGKDTCQGDSGGGIYVKNNGKFIAVGVVSYGDGCARPAKPGIYTKISYYINWINQTIFETI